MKPRWNQTQHYTFSWSLLIDANFCNIRNRRMDIPFSVSIFNWTDCMHENGLTWCSIKSRYIYVSVKFNSSWCIIQKQHKTTIVGCTVISLIKMNDSRECSKYLIQCVQFCRYPSTVSIVSQNDKSQKSEYAEIMLKIVSYLLSQTQQRTLTFHFVVHFNRASRKSTKTQCFSLFSMQMKKKVKAGKNQSLSGTFRAHKLNCWVYCRLRHIMNCFMHIEWNSWKIYVVKF